VKNKKNKRNGLDNPPAQLRASAPTLEEVLASRMIADPLTLLAQMDAGCGAGACSTCGATTVSSWLARYSAIVRSRP
jgi:acetyl-CoA acetyltransferase